MEAVKAEAGFEGTLPEFVTFLRTDPQFVADTPDELMGRGLHRQAGRRPAGRVFRFLPRYRHGIRPVDPAIAPFYTAGRAGRVLPDQYLRPALAPGLQYPGADHARMRARTFPSRRRSRWSGCGTDPVARPISPLPRWVGLYTEYLGNEMGIYRTPYERFGQFSYEMWRAGVAGDRHRYSSLRLEPGRAVDYLASRTALSEHEVGTEVDRYIAGRVRLSLTNSAR